MEEKKVIQMPPKTKEVQEYSVDFKDRGSYVIIPPTMRVSREAKAAYSKGWMEGIKNGLMSEDKLKKFVRENDIFEEDLFKQLEEKEALVEELRTENLKEETEDRNQKIITIRNEISDIREKMSNLPDTAESYGREYEDAVIVVGSVFLKTSGNKKIPVWKTVDAYLDSRDTSGLNLVLTLFQKLVSYGIDPTEENIKEMFPDLYNLLKSLQEEESPDE